MKPRQHLSPTGAASKRRLPRLSAPVVRSAVGTAHLDGAGIDASASKCDGLRGLAQQMCYATLYGVLS